MIEDCYGKRAQKTVRYAIKKEPGIFDLIEGDSTVLEKEPLEKAAKMGELKAYKHDGFWQCMDTKREKEKLEELWASGKAPWKVWED